MIYKIYHPSPALCHIVDYYWYAHTDQSLVGVQHFFTPLLQTLAFNFNQKEDIHKYNGSSLSLKETAYFFGQATSPREIHTVDNGLKMIGIKFKPTGMSRLLGLPMNEIADKIIPASNIWTKDLPQLLEQISDTENIEKAINILEKFLLFKSKQIKPLDRIENISVAISLIKQFNGNLSIKELQNLTNISRKTLERAFIKHIELFSSIVRYNATKMLLDNASTASITHISYDAGFYDNSHLAAEFKRFSGYTPSDYKLLIKKNAIQNFYFKN